MSTSTSPRPYDRTSHDGRTVDWLTKAALIEVEGRLGYSLNLTQGSYNAGGVATSAGTHDGGGVIDVTPHAGKQAREVLELRRAGFAAWFRPTRPGVWNAHIHAVLIGNRQLAPAAADQVVEYLAGFDGLAGDGRDTGPRQFVDRRFSWRTGAGRITRARGRLAQARALLATGTRGYRLRKAQRAIDMALEALPEVP